MIAFAPAHLVGREQALIAEAMQSRHLSGNGPFTKKCEAMLGQWHKGSRVLLTTNCTHSLEMMSILLNLGPGDKVIVPSYTFVSSANAFAKFGVEPVFADIAWNSLCLDVHSVKQRLTPEVKAVVNVNYGGHGGHLPELRALCEKHNITLLEDNAQGIYATHDGQPLGTFGALSALSFHATKNISCGEGGALVVNDPALVERAEIIREKGTDRSRFLRGMTDKYTWRDLGSSYVISEILAAMLLAQLEHGDQIQATRKSYWKRYHQGLSAWAALQGAELPELGDLAHHSAHVFYLLAPSHQGQGALIEHLAERGVQATFHYQPLHLSDMGRRYGGSEGDCPVSERVAQRIVRLPLSAAHTAEEISTVIKAVTEFQF